MFAELRTQRKQYLQLAQRKGISRWRWYILLWIGFTMFIFSIVLFGVALPSVYLLTIGLTGWIIALWWQIQREKIWCEELMSRIPDNDPQDGELVLSLVTYLMFLHGDSNLWGHLLSEEVRGCLLFLFYLWCWLLFFPSLFHVFLGKRNSWIGLHYNFFRCLWFLITLCFLLIYGLLLDPLLRRLLGRSTLAHFLPTVGSPINRERWEVYFGFYDEIEVNPAIKTITERRFYLSYFFTFLLWIIAKYSTNV
ncbi:hypothetical protein [Pasteuria penetrans]|uniref:hypothetical protein n=1 Tax=Pasteuria penetrans TaxID=86005 RepID=UPI0011EF614E|nr:hypothetical protein [Pasteuria penetrans]